MSLQSFNSLQKLVDRNLVTDVKEGAINSASIDLTLASKILVESPTGFGKIISLKRREPLVMDTVILDSNKSFILGPGQFILCSTEQTFNLPNFISGQYQLKSSMARIGLEHLKAGWCDAGWNSSALTLELKNMCQYHSIELNLGDFIGQIAFFSHSPVPEDKSYSTRGRYNGDKEVSGIKK